jgi:uncharacterized membrane protein
MDDGHTERIIAQARQEIAERNTALQRGWWNGHARLLLPALVLAALFGFALAPGELPTKLSRAMAGICGLRPSHSYFAGSLQLPLEARLLGMYGGFALTLSVLLERRRFGAQRLGNRTTIIVLALLFVSMVLDGVHSTFAELGLMRLYTPTNELRLSTGLFSGVALAPVLLWLLNGVALPRSTSNARPVVGSPMELGIPLLFCSLFAWLVIQEHRVLYYPMALIGVVGVVAMLAIAALLVILSVSQQAGTVRQADQFVAPGSLAVLVAFGVLLGTSALR